MKRKIGKKEILMQAALDVFMEKGFERTTIDEIVNRAVCGKGTFYRYFHNKENLYQELDANFLKSLKSNFEKYCRESLPVEEYLLAGLRTFIKVFTQNNKIGLIRFERDMRLCSAKRKESSNQLLEIFFFMKPRLEMAKRSGEIKEVDTESILSTIIGTAHYFVFREFKLGISYTDHELKKVIDNLIYGVKAT
ncbi:MAG: TetR/AcrR family transcriptional regulator [Candidatus Rifleibacteriota bacterium]